MPRGVDLDPSPPRHSPPSARVVCGVCMTCGGARESLCAPRAATQVYRDSTSLETLLGFLHLSDPARLQQVMDFILESEGAEGGAGQGGEPQAGDGPAGSGGAGPTAPG